MTLKVIGSIPISPDESITQLVEPWEYGSSPLKYKLIGKPLGDVGSSPTTLIGEVMKW